MTRGWASAFGRIDVLGNGYPFAAPRFTPAALVARDQKLINSVSKVAWQRGAMSIALVSEGASRPERTCGRSFCHAALSWPTLHPRPNTYAEDDV